MTSSKSRVGAIDIGTNSVLLLIAEETSMGLVPLVERATITRLGQRVDKTRTLAPDAVSRTLECLANYAKELDLAGVVRRAVVGTSAMRDASNGADFQSQAEALLGVRPRVISGEEEARLTFSGGLSCVPVKDRRVGVFDIGGGSTEFIVGDRTTGAVESAVSLDVGSVRLTERWVHSDPLSPDDRAALEDAIDRVLVEIPDARAIPWVGVAGTVTTLAAIAWNVAPYAAERVHGRLLGVGDLDRVTEELLRESKAERLGHAALSPGRADVIGTGAILCSRILRHLGASELWVSDRGVRWGLAEALART